MNDTQAATAEPTAKAEVLSLKTLDKRMKALEEIVRSIQHRTATRAIEENVQATQHALLYLMEYCLYNEGRDRHYGPKPHERVREIRRLADQTRKEIANGFAPDHRPDPVESA